MTKIFEYNELEDKEIQWYEDQGCVIKNVPVKRGGMVLWDSRTVHDNVRPEVDREHDDRWRHVVFVCMTPAIWASEKDLKKKQRAYEKMIMTAHWPSQGVTLFDEYHPSDYPELKVPLTLPEVARTTTAMQLAGAMPYDFDDGDPIWA